MSLGCFKALEAWQSVCFVDVISSLCAPAAAGAGASAAAASDARVTCRRRLQVRLRTALEKLAAWAEAPANWHGSWNAGRAACSAALRCGAQSLRCL